MITAAKARTIVRKTLAHGTAAGMKPLSVIVVDAGGHPVAFERSDGASAGRFAIAQGKAYGSIMLGLGGAAQMARAESQDYFMNAMNGLFGGLVVPVPGGVLVHDKRGRLMGAVGVTGDTSENDAAAALAGIDAAGLTGTA